MKFLASHTVAVGALLAELAGAHILRGNKMVPPALKATSASLGKRTTGQTTFEQLIDHSNASLGTFSQRYWWSDEFYAGPGSPVVFFTPGEIAADEYTGYLTNRTITGLFAQAIGGAVVMLEHRYWGTSSPVDTLTTENLQWLTLENSIKDTTYFASHVSLPFDSNGTSAPDKAPWVFSGGSYSGALSAWTNAKDPGTFWAYHASSAVVEVIDDFWQYFAPVQEGAPKNCTADVELVIDYVDGVLKNGTDSQVSALKTKFGLGGVEHHDDFASALENGPWLWQSNQFYTGYSSFYQFCDYVENVWPDSNNSVPGESGVGLTKALEGFAKWTSELLVPGYCESYGYWTGEYNLDCFDTYNASSPLYTDLTLDNVIDRQWQWFLCNEPFEYWQDGAPTGTPSIVSRLVDSAYWTRQCPLFFPTEDGFTYGLAEGKTVDTTNAYTGGWDYVNTTRLIWANGQYDPWKDATVSSEYRPGGPLVSTTQTPVNVIPDGIHCSDLLAENGAVNAGVQAVIDNEIEVISGWVNDFYVQKKIKRRNW